MRRIILMLLQMVCVAIVHCDMPSEKAEKRQYS